MAANLEELRTSIESAIGNPPIVFRHSKTRQEIDGLTPAVMSYLDNIGKGPKDRILIGRQTAYTRASYISWFLSRVKQVDEKEVADEKTNS